MFWRAVILVAALPALAADRWQMQYFYDEVKSTLTLNDIKFSTPRRGVAVGFVADGKRNKPMSVVTSDGGAHWTLQPIEQVGLSLFFLPDGLGWMVTAPRGLWQTTEGGRSWKKLPDPPRGLMRVFFLNENHGFGIGAKKLVVETQDGGKHWTPLPAAAEPKTTPERTFYTWINFTGNNGIITGYSQTQRIDQHLPDWVEPDTALERSERPHLNLTLKTADGGKTWSTDTASMFGRISRFRIGANGYALALTEFGASFAYPAEVYRIDGKTGATERIYRDKARAITDAWISPAGNAYLSGVEVAGKLRTSPIPGKLKILRSADFKTWSDMAVDYRAVATRVTMAMVDERNIWVATDTGMILKLGE